MIESTITEGAPLFNAGDHMGCYKLYLECAQRLLGDSNLLSWASEESATLLRTAIGESQQASSPGKQAWALRPALDRLMQEARGLRMIESTITEGAPLFNAGDHMGCYK